MIQVFEKKQYCYGCGKCGVVCPVDAISMERDEEGFSYPVINSEKCIDCEICVKECIYNREVEKRDVSDVVLACAAKKEEILQKSTSGGIFFVMASTVLQQDGVVYGAAYEAGSIKHIRVEKPVDLAKLQGAKYVQSNMEKVLPMIGMDLARRKKVLFSGTPCQVAAVRELYPNAAEQLLLVELVCRGTPSPKVWEAYVGEKEREWGEIVSVSFRDKCTGWNSSSIVYSLKEGNNSFRHNMDAYMMGFLQALFMRPSCHECKFKGADTLGDVKIGDFWGIGNYKDAYKSSNGTSLVIIETEMGKKWMQMIEQEVEKEEVPYKFALVYNPYLELSKKPAKQRNAFFEQFGKETDSTSQLILKHLTPAFSQEDRYWCQYPIVEGMLERKLAGKSTADYFRNNHYKKIAIYGLGKLGKFLVQDLEGTDIEIICLVDKNYSRFPEEYRGVKVIGPHELNEHEFDCIVVSVIHLYNSILEVLLVEGVELDKVISMGSIV